MTEGVLSPSRPGSDPGAGVAESGPEAAVAVDPTTEFRVGVARPGSA